jgi:hypothetical protein
MDDDGTLAVDAVGVGLAAFGMLNPTVAAFDSRGVRADVHFEFRPPGERARSGRAIVFPESSFRRASSAEPVSAP